MKHFSPVKVFSRGMLVIIGFVVFIVGMTCRGGATATSTTAPLNPPSTLSPSNSPVPQLPTTQPAQPNQPTSGAVYYIRPDGGSAEQCTGLVDAAYPGSGNGQPCAWNHPFQALPPADTPRIAGGDTLVIDAGDYRMGVGAAGAEACDPDGAWDCHMPPLPSGPDPAHPTRLLGAGWDTGCTTSPELWGVERADWIIDLTGSNNIEIACLEITDHSGCIEDHTGGLACERDHPPYGDWAVTCIYAQDSANVTLRDLNIHGLGHGGVWAGRLTDWSVENVRIAANGLVGWDGDIEGDDSNSGTLTFHHLTVEWNGCGETYPEQQIQGCWGQEAGGYGDGFGTGETGGHWVIEDSAFLYNTSDGLDLLYARRSDANIEIRRTIAEGNDGNQIKTSGPTLIENSIIISNCGFFHGMAGWNNDDDCRAGGDALALNLFPGSSASVINTTISGEGNCLVIAECALDQTCNGNETILMRNVIFQGQKVFFSPEDDACFAWYDDESSPPMPANPFQVEYSLINGVRFGNVTPCPGANNICDVAPGLVNTSIDDFNAHMLTGSPAINTGTTDGAPLVDFDGLPRDAAPDIGAYEWRQIPSFIFYLPFIERWHTGDL
jgi:hypothetical protein